MTSNKGWVKVVMYAPEEDKEVGRITKGPCTTCRMPKWRDKMPVRWGEGRQKSIDMSLHFPTSKTLDSTESLAAIYGDKGAQSGLGYQMSCTDPQEIIVDGVTPSSLTAYLKEGGLGDIEARTSAARITAGGVRDTIRLHENMLSTRAAALCRNTGSRIGILRTPNNGDARRNKICKCCENGARQGG